MPLQPDGKAIIGGHFVSYDATNFNYLVRTLVNGLPDFSFDSGTGIIGPNNFVSAVAIDPQRENPHWRRLHLFQRCPGQPYRPPQ